VLHTVHTNGSPQVTIGGKQVHIGGMCKGSGMIHPNMASPLQY
jgi:glutamate N-acetyltransferase/amino-acid N-acetyltransferase